jgi:phosphatidylglycerol:prolipoprotein diacylglycerol transferase
MAVAWLVVRRRGVAFLNLADIMAPSLALGLMVTRVGCFLNGCCYGKPTDSFLGVTFPFQNVVGSSFDSPLHPTQLYSSLTGLVILLLLLWIDRRPRPQGQLFGLYLIFAGAGRFLVDMFRFYEANAYVLGSLTLSQVISLGLLVVGVLLLVRTRRAAPVRSTATQPTHSAKIAEHSLS